MATKGQLRRRQPQRISRSRKTNDQPPNTSSSPTSPTSLQGKWFKEKMLYPFLTVLRAGLFGLLSAASFSSSTAALVLFIATIVCVFAGLLFTFMSIIRRHDQTPVSLPSVYKPDGSVQHQEAITIYDHDKKIATYFASELPCLGMAAAWFYIWSSVRPTFAIFAVYVAYRFTYHPLFRIHLLQEPNCDDFERPFGGVPLFREDDSAAVKVINGSTAFDVALEEAAEAQLVVVDFSAKWCGPCRAIAPLYKEMAAEMKDVLFLTVDVDVSQDVAAKMAISSIPTFILFKNGERRELLRGASATKLRAAIQQHK